MDLITEAIGDQLALLQTATPLEVQLGNYSRRASVIANFTGTLNLLQTPRGNALPKTYVGCSENSMHFLASCFGLHDFFGRGQHSGGTAFLHIGEC